MSLFSSLTSSTSTRNSSQPLLSPGIPAQSWWAVDPYWSLDLGQQEKGIPHERLAPAWQLLVLGDGYTTRNLALLSGQSIEAHRLESIVLDPQQAAAPLALDPLFQKPDPSEIDEKKQKSIVRRQVWLGGKEDGIPLLYGVSWWQPAMIEKTLGDPSLPIGTSLMGSGAAVSRRLVYLAWGDSAPLETLFGIPGPFWARYYWLWQGQQPLTLIYEVFSPALRQYLGSES